MHKPAHPSLFRKGVHDLAELIRADDFLPTLIKAIEPATPPNVEEVRVWMRREREIRESANATVH